MLHSATTTVANDVDYFFPTPDVSSRFLWSWGLWNTFDRCVILIDNPHAIRDRSRARVESQEAVRSGRYATREAQESNRRFDAVILRKKKWEELREQGWSLSKIAKTEKRDRKTVKQWIADIEKYREAAKNTAFSNRSRIRIPGSRRKLKHPELDRALRDAFDERRQAGVMVTVPLLRTAVQELIDELRIDHRGSRGYIKRWMKREKLTYRMRTHMAHKRCPRMLRKRSQSS